MSAAAKTLFTILRNEFWGEPLPFHSLSHAHFKALQRLAERQTVEGFVTGVLMREGIKLEQQDALNVFSRSRMIAQLNNKNDNVLTELASLLTKENISYLVFKGQTLATLYPHPQERTPGDIDFYCPTSDFQRAATLLKSRWNVEINVGESNQHHEFSYHNVPLEMHFRMIKFNNSKIQRYWDSLLETQPHGKTVINGTTICTLNPTVNTLYTFLHLYHHLVELGVGLRQFCDVMQLLHHYRNEIDRQALAKHLDNMGFRRAFCAVGWILIQWLGLPEEEFPLTITQQDKAYEHTIMEIVFSGGNFGKYISNTAVRSGWRYNLETTARKLRHYRLFWQLSPREIRSTLIKEIPQKVFSAVRR